VKYFEKHHVNGNIDWGHYSTRYEWIQIIEDSYRLYKKVWKDFSYATEMVKNYLNLYERIRVEVKGSFAVGSSYTRSQIKNCLGEIYGKHEIKRTPSHLDLNDMFITKEKKIKGERMVEIIGKLK
jgi:hypothetical protein